MHALSPIRRVYFGYLSRMYAFYYAVDNRAVLGIRARTWLRWVPILLLLIGWVRAWPPGVLVLLAALIVWTNYSLWRARRDNYNRFVPDEGILPATEELLNPLPPNTKLAVRVTGPFSVTDREAMLLLRPGTYWHVPLGDHIVMAEERPNKYLYQFFGAASLQDIQQGWLLFGPHPGRTLAVTFLARWGPEYARYGRLYEDGKADASPAKRVTVYLTAPDAEAHTILWQTIVSEARHARNASQATPPAVDWRSSEG